MSKEDEWISVTDAANRLDLSADTIRRLAKAGHLKGRNKTLVPGSSIEILLSSVITYNEKRNKLNR